MKSYDRADGETAKAYAAFTIYRNMGANRSLDRTAAEFYSDPETTQKRPRNKSQISAWSHRWSWVDRCRDYDRDEEMLARSRRKIAQGEEYLKKIENFRDRTETFGMEVLAFNAKFLESLDDRSALIFREIATARAENRRPNLPDGEHEFFLQIPALVRALVNATLGAEEIAADGLGIRRLLQECAEFGDLGGSKDAASSGG
jgi:hypothetical protein